MGPTNAKNIFIQFLLDNTYMIRKGPNLNIKMLCWQGFGGFV